MSKITPFLWFDNNAEEAINYYVSIFKNSKIIGLARPAPDAPILLGSFEINGQEFKAFNGGPLYKFNEAISLFINCEDQAEIDHLWEKLSAGGQELDCGWVKDKFGLAWQVVPKVLSEYLSDSDKEKSGRVFAAMMTMRKFNIEKLKRAYEGQADN